MRSSWMATIAIVSLLAGGSESPAQTSPTEITIYAAASLRDALQAVKGACEGSTGARLTYNFGASSDLARQIMAANKADVFFSADEHWMDRVAEAGLIEAASRRSLLSNQLAVIGPAEGGPSVGSAAELARAGVRRLALANPEAVPAGKYAKAWLESAGVWAAVQGRVVPVLDVRAALAAVETAAAEAAVVYRTDAEISKKVRVLYLVPEAEGPQISYPVAVLRHRPRVDLARKVVVWLSGRGAASAFERYGFIVKPPPPSPQ